MNAERMGVMKIPLKIGLAVVVASLAGAAQAQAQMRFQGMDRDHNGKITWDEWRGSERAFRNADWNGDGELSGDEVRSGARRPAARQQNQAWEYEHNGVRDWNQDGVINQQDELIGQRFNTYDRNGDGRISMDEWRGASAESQLFYRLDRNHDGTLTIEEYATGGGIRFDSQGGPSYGFANLDRNRDGWITRSEWNMGDAEFNRLDINRDNRISPWEFERTAGNVLPRANDRFSNVDLNRDGWLTRNEWSWGDAWFDRVDTNHDNRISRTEFDASARYFNPTTYRYEDTTSPRRNTAFQAGYDRGMSEGRQAGREDYANGHGWDLEGQTELERADSGYYSQLGTLSDYQNGYREAFRLGYKEGFNQH